MGVALFHQDQSAVDTDFVVFYSLGRIFNEYSHDRLYDATLQTSLDEQTHPLREGAYGAVAYPPAVALLFQPLAALPYQVAYRIWFLITLTLYGAGIVLLSRSLFPDSGALRSILLCFAMAYFPFVIEALFNGQLAAVAFFALSLAVREDLRGRPLACGLWLSVCAYKPTLLIWILPMLLVTRRWRACAGFAAGVLALFALTTAAAGVSSWRGYLGALLGFRAGPLRFVLVDSHPRFTLSFWKYVDVISFTTLLTRCAPWIALCVFVVASMIVSGMLVNRWKRSRNPELIWASAIIATLVVNLYTPIYDTTLVVIAVMLTIAGVWNRAGEPMRGEFFLVFIAMFCVAWVSSLPFAVATHVQLLTPLLAVLGVLQYKAMACG